ncbi:conserved membrane hypothetical protein [[Clostridium] ultunense Esp]|nr:conserved membrane hypothetical protein [[Clostridium] ultunense Esp]
MITENWLLLSLFMGISAFSLWADKNTKWGKSIGSVNISLIAGMLLVNFKLVPEWSDIHDIVFTYIVPVSIALLLFQADIKGIIKVGPKLIFTFAIGAIGTMIGAIVAALIFDLGPQSWIVYGGLTATYIGGSANLAAVTTALNLDPAMFVAINAADIVLFFFWMAFLFQAAKSSFFKKRYLTYTESLSNSNSFETDKFDELESHSIKGIDVAIVLAVAIACAAAGELIGRVTGIPGIIFTTTIVLILANFTNINKMTVAQDIGIWLFMVFFVTIGAMALIKDIVASGVNVFWGTGTVILIHGIVTFLLGKVFKLPLEYILLSSCANIAGPGSSGPMAATLGWEDLILPGILIAVLGAAGGTYCGFGIAYFLKAIL